MTPECSNDNIPRGCADEFAKLNAGIQRIETKVDAHADMHQTISARLWGIVKGCFLIAFGWAIGR